VGRKAKIPICVFLALVGICENLPVTRKLAEELPYM
jgi:hypothetical protein